MRSFDLIICGGGIIGPALGYGIAQTGAHVLMLDDGDNAFRAARGNFGLVWFQGKGPGMQSYVEWTRRSIEGYPQLSIKLREDVGINIELQQTGGLEICLTEDEVIARKTEMAALIAQSPEGSYPARFIKPAEANDILNGIRLGPTVLGAMHSPLDGHVNPLKLLHALHAGFQKHGGIYRANAPVRQIVSCQGGFEVITGTARYACGRVVLAAGLGIAELAPQLGMNIPVFPRRGQILVTERTKAILPLTVLTVRQTDEGSILLGDSSEDADFNSDTTGAITANIARRAIATFPVLGDLNLVRTWGALRVLTPDHAPVYDHSAIHPGAYAATSHSGVTLAAANVECAADWLLEDRPPKFFQAFKSDRFHVQAVS